MENGVLWGPFLSGYSNELLTGVEYQAASHMLHKRWIKDGLFIIICIRRRYDNKRRKPRKNPV